MTKQVEAHRSNKPENLTRGSRIKGAVSRMALRALLKRERTTSVKDLEAVIDVSSGANKLALATIQEAARIPTVAGEKSLIKDSVIHDASEPSVHRWEVRLAGSDQAVSPDHAGDIVQFQRPIQPFSMRSRSTGNVVAMPVANVSIVCEAFVKDCVWSPATTTLYFNDDPSITTFASGDNGRPVGSKIELNDKGEVVFFGIHSSDAKEYVLQDSRYSADVDGFVNTLYSDMHAHSIAYGLINDPNSNIQFLNE